MNIRQGPYLGEIKPDGSFIISRRSPVPYDPISLSDSPGMAVISPGTVVEVGHATTAAAAFELVEKILAERCHRDRHLFLVSKTP